MKKLIYNSLKAFTLCAGFFSLNACKEKSIVKPGTLIPPVDNINTFEVKGFDISVQNTHFDSLRSNDYNYPIVALGQISNDLFFGKTVAGAYMQFVPPTEYFTFPDNITVLDSAVLVMPYLNFSYGDTDRSVVANALALKAYEITDPDFIYGDTNIANWYSSKTFQCAPTPIGEAEITLRSLSDTAYLLNNEKVTGLLRMPLSPSFGAYIINLPASDMVSGTTFISKFKGIFLAPDTTKNKNTLAYFSMTGGSSSNALYQNAIIEFYYHIANDTALKRSVFPFTASNAYSNHIKRNYNGTPAQSFVNSNDSRYTMVIQSYPGFRSQVIIDLDDKIPHSLINKATLEITTIRTPDQKRFNPPTQLIINRINSDNTISPVMDVLDATGASNTDYLAFLDAQPKVVMIDGVEYYRYNINIPREIQRTLSLGEKQLRLRVATAQVYPGAHRMIAYGPNAPEDLKIKLNVIYTKQN